MDADKTTEKTISTTTRINLLIITCRDFNFSGHGEVLVKLIRVKRTIKIKLELLLPKKLSKATSFYFAHKEEFSVDTITNSSVADIHNYVVERLNYTDLFMAHYGYHIGDVAGKYKSTDKDFLSWLTDTLFSFEAVREVVVAPRVTPDSVDGAGAMMGSVGMDIAGGLDATAVVAHPFRKAEDMFSELTREYSKIHGIDIELIEELKDSPLAKRIEARRK